MTTQRETINSYSLVGAGRLERLLRALHQCCAQRHRPDRAVSRRRQDCPDDIVFGRILPALGIALPIGNLYYAYLAYRLAKAEKPQRRDGDAVRAERAAYVHRRVRHHAAGLSEDQERAARLAGRARLGVHHRRHRADRRLRWTDHSPIDAARSDARHARRHFDRLHLDAAGFPDVGGAVDLVHLTRHRADGLDRQRAAARGVPGGLAAVIVGTAIAWIAAVLGWIGYRQRGARFRRPSLSSASICRCRAPM